MDTAMAKTKPNNADIKDMSFEHALKELETIVNRLERGDVELEELTRLWERGEELYRRCAEQLSTAQGKVEELARRLGTDPSGT
jgi:exodeoxyribonuclease VII small subunit